jgi:hypothetical protein
VGKSGWKVEIRDRRMMPRWKGQEAMLSDTLGGSDDVMVDDFTLAICRFCGK